MMGERAAGGGVFTPLSRVMTPVLGSRRIAARIFGGYMILFLFFMVAGFLVPYLIASVLDQAVKDYTTTVGFVDNSYAMRRAAVDSGNDLQGYLLYGDASFRQQFGNVRDDYRNQFRKVEEFAAGQQNSSLDGQMKLADSAYRRWYTRFATPEFAAADRALLPHNIAVSRAAASRSAKAFDGVQTAMDRLVDFAERYRQQQLRRAQLSERWRVGFTIGTPIVAMLIAVGLARFFTVGITKPIEELRLAAEEVERGDMTRLLLDQYPHDDDEIGDLAHALSRMARTIGEREAILRAQNEALAAIGRRIEAVLNATNDGIVLLDRAEGFSLMNERFASLFGVDAGVMRDQTFTDAAPLFLDRFKNKAAATARFREWIADWEAVADETMETREPSPRTLRVYTAPVRGELGSATETNPDAGIMGRIFVFRDVTRETIVDRMKTEFVSTVSHELRTPLTAIKGYVDLMMGGKTGDLTPVQSEFLGMVQASTRRLTDLINDMLDISRIESGRMSLRQETIEYLPVVHEAMRMMHNQAEARGVSLRLDMRSELTPAPTVRGDRDRITQVLVNLLSNAIKYSPSGGDVSVRVEQENGVMTTCVADTGIGINAEDQDRLFQKFFRADNSTTRDVGGTGLGLAITRAILERMHGTIRVESEPGSGSQFYFTLPVAQRGDDAVTPARVIASWEASATPPAANADARALVLIVDEEQTSLHRMTGLFRSLGYVTSSAMNFAEATRRARDLRPDAVIVNLAASRMNALSLLHTLRAEDKTHALRIFVCALAVSGGEVLSQASVVIANRNALPLEEAITLDCEDTPESLGDRLREKRTESDDAAAIQIDLADFARDTPDVERLAIALQQLTISGTPIVLYIRDSNQGVSADTTLVSLASPEMPSVALENMAEVVGGLLRAGLPARPAQDN